MRRLPDNLRDDVSSTEVDLGILRIEPRTDEAGVAMREWFRLSEFGDELCERFDLGYEVAAPCEYVLASTSTPATAISRAPYVNLDAVQRAIDRRQHAQSPRVHPLIQQFNYKHTARAQEALEAHDDAQLARWQQLEQEQE